MIRHTLLAAACAAAALAQQPAAAPQTASVSGVVKDSVTGRPLANYTVSTFVNASFVGDMLLQTSATRQPSAITDEQGRYKLADLPPGAYRITARGNRDFGAGVTRHVQLAGRDLDNIDFSVPISGRITGRVLDENREPVPNMAVYLVSAEYYTGALGYFFKNVARTDDRGVYTLNRVEPGRPYLVMADRGERSLPARSDAPLDPKLRRRVPTRTFYPNSTDRQSAAALILRSGETREGIDIEVKKSASYCIEGTASGLAGAASLMVMLEAAQPSYGQSRSGGMFGRSPSATTAADGKFRFCGLPPGAYRLSSADKPSDAANRALVPVEIVDRDVAANLTLGPGIPLQGEVVWDGAAPETAPTVQARIRMNPLFRAPIAGDGGFARVDIPGPFTIPGLLPSDYEIWAFVAAPGLYVKDVLYGGASVLYAPLRLGSVPGDLGARVVIGRDGATLTARVQDKDGNPLPDLQVLIMPAEIASEAMLASALIIGHSDQAGQYRSQSLAPGKYLVLATEDQVDASPQSTAALWRSRARFQEVTLAPNGAAQVTLTPVKLE